MSTSQLPSDYTSAAPGAPDSAALARVKHAAQGRAHTLEPAARRISLRTIAMPALLLVAMSAAIVWVMTPHVDDSAFARQQAVAALLPRDAVLHTAFTMSVSRVGGGTQASSAQEWVDADTQSSRSTFTPESASVGELTIRNGRTVRSLGRDGGSDGSYRIVQYEAPDELTSPGGAYVDLLRQGLETGDATVISRETDDDGEYWVVEQRIELHDAVTGDSTEKIVATMRVGDYRLRQLAIERRGNHPHDGEWSEDIVLRFSEWKTISRASLASDFFDLGQFDAAAPQGTIVEVPLEP